MSKNTQQPASLTRVLTTFALVMITVTSVDSLRNLPATAFFGSTLIFFFFAAALLFMIPTALVSAELATGWPQNGGVYVWVREALGKKFGFLAIWFQWIENVIWYPTILSFIAGTFAYLFSPNLANNKYYMVSVILSVFWGTTGLNLLGMKASSRFSILCAIFGLFVPMMLIIGLGLQWMLTGHHLAISLSPQQLIPQFNNPQILVALTGVVLCFCGMEIATVHAQEVKNPERSYPRAIWISTIIILFTLVLSSLAIAIVIPKQQLSLVAGIMQAFRAFLTADHLSWLIPFAAIFIIFGGLGSLSNWVIAPSKGLMIAMRDDDVAPFLQGSNKKGAPAKLLIYQSIIVSFIALVFFLMPTINSSYWILTALAAQLYMFMYILMFIAAIVLRYKKPEVKRAYTIPGGRKGIWLVCGVGILTCLFVICLGFFPPEGVNVGNIVHYEELLVGGLIFMTMPPFLFYAFKFWRRAKPQVLSESLS